MKGIKFLDKDMKAVNGDGMTYELGKTYKTEDDIKLRYRGYHFCKSFEDCCEYYSISNFRVFDIETGNNVLSDKDLYCTNEITLIREWSKEEIIKYIEDKLIIDEDWYARVAVAKQGYGLDILINDDYSIVRESAQEYLNKEEC